MKPAVFLDRDGTLIEEVGYLDNLDRMAFYPWSVDAVRLLNRASFLVLLVTNQAGVARGLFGEELVVAAHREIGRRLEAGGARLDAYYYCPHHPTAPVATYRVECDCRKPRTGMIRRAERAFDIDISRSFVVGDRWRDIEMGREAGARGILVRSGYGRSEEKRPVPGLEPALVCENLMEAVAWILRQ
jgi:D-glycero-D-manno-heptose 1,7-bisphosphate phosphatase